MRLPDVILEQRVIPVARGLTVDRAAVLADALLAGGLGSIEVTMESGDGATVLRELSSHSIVVGAGTVTGIAQAEEAVAAGARFLVSPHLDPALVEWARASRVPHLPGVFTPTEVAAASSLGVDTVKLFPASLGGPGLVSALRGPFPETGFVATGGIDGSNAAAFLEAGSIAVGVGAWLTGSGDAALVSERAARLREVV